jgi:hypothetical protein
MIGGRCVELDTAVSQPPALHLNPQDAIVGQNCGQVERMAVPEGNENLHPNPNELV